jgi:hypothetical protein
MLIAGRNYVLDKEASNAKKDNDLDNEVAKQIE